MPCRCVARYRCDACGSVICDECGTDCACVDRDPDDFDADELGLDPEEEYE